MLKVVEKKKRKKEEILGRQKIEDITIKYYKDRREISLFRKKKRNYENNIGDDIDPNQTNDKYLL